jgi:hypothetical protein
MSLLIRHYDKKGQAFTPAPGRDEFSSVNLDQAINLPALSGNC